MYIFKTRNIVQVLIRVFLKATFYPVHKSHQKLKVALQFSRFVLMINCLFVVKQMGVVVQTVAMPDRWSRLVVFSSLS